MYGNMDLCVLHQVTLILFRYGKMEDDADYDSDASDSSVNTVKSIGDIDTG